MSKRNPAVLGIWGPRGTRVIAAESYWRQPLKWDRDAAAAGERRRVFCASLADVFEGPESMPESDWPKVEAARERLFGMIAATPHLDWLLLTKRPRNAAAYLTWNGHGRVTDENCNCLQCRIVRSAAAIFGGDRSANYGPMVVGMASYLWQNWPLPNLWIGTSVEDQGTADERIPHLLKVPARVRFLSCEPLLGPVDLSRWLGLDPGNTWADCLCDEISPEDRPCLTCDSRRWLGQQSGLSWIIVGGESGPKARPMHPAWVRSLRDQATAAGVPFLFKQWGEWLGTLPTEHKPECTYMARCHEWNGGFTAWRVGKKSAGRMLDGVEWSEFPQ
jgi:protein gp37